MTSAAMPHLQNGKVNGEDAAQFMKSISYIIGFGESRVKLVIPKQQWSVQSKSSLNQPSPDHQSCFHSWHPSHNTNLRRRPEQLTSCVKKSPTCGVGRRGLRQLVRRVARRRDG